MKEDTNTRRLSVEDWQQAVRADVKARKWITYTTLTIVIVIQFIILIVCYDKAQQGIDTSSLRIAGILGLVLLLPLELWLEIGTYNGQNIIDNFEIITWAEYEVDSVVERNVYQMRTGEYLCVRKNYTRSELRKGDRVYVMKLPDAQVDVVGVIR